MEFPLYKKVACYRAMRLQLIDLKEYGIGVGFCPAFFGTVEYSVLRERDVLIETIMLDCLPELRAFKPITNSDGRYWFNRRDLQTRLGIIDGILSTLTPRLTLMDKFNLLFLRKIK